MKIIVSKGVRRIIIAAVIVCLFTVAAVNITGYFFDCKYISVIAAVSEVDKYALPI